MSIKKDLIVIRAFNREPWMVDNEYYHYVSIGNVDRVRGMRFKEVTLQGVDLSELTTDVLRALRLVTLTN